MKYSHLWDLGTIPSDLFNNELERRGDLTGVSGDLLNQEVGRRRRAAGPTATYQKLRLCDNCKTPLNATQRRKPCPECGYKHPR